VKWGDGEIGKWYICILVYLLLVNAVCTSKAHTNSTASTAATTHNTHNTSTTSNTCFPSL